MARLTQWNSIFSLLILLTAIFAAAHGQTPRNAEELFNRAERRLNEAI